MGFELNSPSITKSYLVISQSPQLVMKNLKLYSQINTNGRWMFVLVNAKQSEIKALLIESWRSFKMVNILALSISGSELIAMTFNPFKTNGEIWTKNVTVDEIESVSVYATDLLERKIKNLDGFVLNFTIFESEASATPVYDETKQFIVRYEDVEGEMAGMFGKYLKAKINYVTPNDSFQMGFRQPNGSFTGAIGQVESGEADMSCNSRFFTYTGTKNCAYLDPVEVINLRYMVPKQNATVIKLQYAFLQMFNFQVRCVFALVFVVLIFVWVCLDAFSIAAVDERKPKLTFNDMFFYIISIMSLVSIPETKFTRNHDRMIFAFLLMFSLIVCNSFQGAVTSYLSNQGQTNDINTLEDLIKSDLKLHALVVIKGIVC